MLLVAAGSDDCCAFGCSGRLKGFVAGFKEMLVVSVFSFTIPVRSITTGSATARSARSAGNWLLLQWVAVSVVITAQYSVA